MAVRHTPPVPQFGVTFATVDPQSSWTRRNRGLYAALGGAVTLLVVGLIAHVAQQPFLVPSLGPTAFVIYFAAGSRQAAPRNVVCGQLIGVACGVVSVVLLGLRGVPVDLTNIGFHRLAAAVLALSLTFILMSWLGVEHAPAGATTLIVALGVVHTSWGILALTAAVFCTVGIAIALNRIFKVPYPMWAPREAEVASL